MQKIFVTIVKFSLASEISLALRNFCEIAKLENFARHSKFR